MARVRRNRNLKAEYLLPENHIRWANAAGSAGVEAIRRHAPVHTGATANTIRFHHLVLPKGPTVRYKAATRYAIFPEVGTGIYGPMHRYITPTTAKALSWIDQQTGQRRFAKRVKGQRPQRFFKKGLEEVFSPANVVYYGAKGGPSV